MLMRIVTDIRSSPKCDFTPKVDPLLTTTSVQTELPFAVDAHGICSFILPRYSTIPAHRNHDFWPGQHVSKYNRPLCRSRMPLHDKRDVFPTQIQAAVSICQFLCAGTVLYQGKSGRGLSQNVTCGSSGMPFGSLDNFWSNGLYIACQSHIQDERGAQQHPITHLSTEAIKFIH